MKRRALLPWVATVAGLLNPALIAPAAEQPKKVPPAELDKLVKEPPDLSPWAYVWRADRKVQEKPEAYFIPRRLDRIDRIYRPLGDLLSEREKKYIRWQAMLPAPKGRLHSAVLWLGTLRGNAAISRIELRWPADGGAVPPREAVETRIYPSQAGWFGLVRDEPLAEPEVSPDGRTWVYRHLTEKDPRTGKPRTVGEKPTDMVAVFLDESKAKAGVKHTCPSIHAIHGGAWKRMDLEIEWGLRPGTEKADFDGRLETYIGHLGRVVPLADDEGTTAAGPQAWRSRAAEGPRRGIAAPVLYFPQGLRGGRYSPFHTRVTVWTKTGGFTFLPECLEKGPIYVPEYGFFATKAGSGKTGRQFAAELAAKDLKTIPQMTREHGEAASWEEVMRQIKLPGCKPGTVIPPIQPFEEPPETAMRAHLSDERWTDAWRRGSWQLGQARGGWQGLSFEAAPMIHAMDLVGHSEMSARKLDYWLKAPGVKPDGDYADGEGALDYGAGMKHGIGFGHDGTHSATNRILFTMAERYFLTNDKEWFQKNRARMQAAADWMIRQRNLYMKEAPNRQDLGVAGLEPPLVLGDTYLGRSLWLWYFLHDVYSIQALYRFAEALGDFDSGAARKYREAAAGHREALQRAVEREIARSPVRPVRDGTYRTYIPTSPYRRGTKIGESFGVYSETDIGLGALPLADVYGVLDPWDARLGGHLDLIEEGLMNQSLVEARKGAGLSSADNWFWNGIAGLAKASAVAQIHLRRDDVPCFLRFWVNNYAAFVQPHGGLTEGSSLKGYASAPTDKPSGDLGTTAWFMENFRNLLVMEEGPSLWLARAIPRAWLEQGKKVSVNNAPTHFGTVAYEIVSDVDNGKITATVEMPARKTPASVILRFRHPTAAPIRSVEVNGKSWKEFNKDKETIELKGLTGAVAVTARY